MKSKIFSLWCIAFVNLIVFTVGTVKADEPLPPPADYSIKSANGKYEAFFQVKENKATIYETGKSSAKKSKTKLWEMNGWFRNTYLSNDGANLIVFYNGANLLELDYKPDEVMISFYERGNLLNEIRLNQLLENPSPAALEKTVSHYRWVSTYGMNDKQIFEVSTTEKKKFEFDIKTGSPIGTPLYVSSNDAPNDSSTSQSNQNKQTNQTNSANANQLDAPKETVNTNQTDSKKETAGCQAAVLGIIGCAVLGSIFINQPA